MIRWKCWGEGVKGGLPAWKSGGGGGAIGEETEVLAEREEGGREEICAWTSSIGLHYRLRPGS